MRRSGRTVGHFHIVFICFRLDLLTEWIWRPSIAPSKDLIGLQDDNRQTIRDYLHKWFRPIFLPRMWAHSNERRRMRIIHSEFLRRHGRRLDRMTEEMQNRCRSYGFCWTWLLAPGFFRHYCGHFPDKLWLVTPFGVDGFHQSVNSVAASLYEHTYSTHYVLRIGSLFS